MVSSKEEGRAQPLLVSDRCLYPHSPVSSTNEHKSRSHSEPAVFQAHQMEKDKCWPKENLTGGKKEKKKNLHHSEWCVKNSWEVNTVNPRLGELASGEKFHKCSSPLDRGT